VLAELTFIRHALAKTAISPSAFAVFTIIRARTAILTGQAKMAGRARNGKIRQVYSLVRLDSVFVAGKTNPRSSAMRFTGEMRRKQVNCVF
jgi:hypothetical protein